MDLQEVGCGGMDWIEVFTQYCSGDQIEKNEADETRSTHGDGRGLYRVLVGKPEGIVRPRREWEDNLKMNFQEVGCRGMDWIDVAQDRDRWREIVNAVMKLWAS